jgi:hypothetical protein
MFPLAVRVFTLAVRYVVLVKAVYDLLAAARMIVECRGLGISIDAVRVYSRQRPRKGQ